MVVRWWLVGDGHAMVEVVTSSSSCRRRVTAGVGDGGAMVVGGR